MRAPSPCLGRHCLRSCFKNDPRVSELRVLARDARDVMLGVVQTPEMVKEKIKPAIRPTIRRRRGRQFAHRLQAPCLSSRIRASIPDRRLRLMHRARRSRHCVMPRELQLQSNRDAAAYGRTRRPILRCCRLLSEKLALPSPFMLRAIGIG